MRTRLWWIGLAVSTAALAVDPGTPENLEAPFDSDVPGLPIPNAHVVADGPGTLIRGMSPHAKNRVAALKRYGITDVLIFKQDTRGEVKRLMTTLARAGYPEASVTNIPFEWRQIKSIEQACRYTVEALQILRRNHQTDGRKLYFHCTVGEDRTGYLAGLYRMLVQKIGPEKAWTDELCRYGYGAGDPTKPAEVIQKLDEGLTPLFWKMAGLIESRRLTLENLDRAACDDIQSVTYAAKPLGAECPASPLAKTAPPPPAPVRRTVHRRAPVRRAAPARKTVPQRPKSK